MTKTESTTYPICPRCLGYIPNNYNPGRFSGALSRVDDVEICSECGNEEATQAMVAPDAWPIHFFSFPAEVTAGAAKRHTQRLTGRPSAPKCPRCDRFIPSDRHPGSHRGVWSESSGEEVCLACGLEESGGRPVDILR